MNSYVDYTITSPLNHHTYLIIVTCALYVQGRSGEFQVDIFLYTLLK